MFHHTFVCEAQVHKALKHTGNKTNNHTFGMTLNKKGHAKKKAPIVTGLKQFCQKTSPKFLFVAQAAISLRFG